MHCDQCQLNFWKFPTCEPCECNGFADYCNQTTGECINCKHHTYGYNCEKYIKNNTHNKDK